MRSVVPAVSALLVIQFFVAVTIAADTYPESKTADGPDKGIVLSEFIYVDAPFPECHATTIAESKGSIVAAWFGGQHEKNPDVGIWVAHRTAAGWSKPVEVVNGIQHSRLRYPCWNPVLFQPRQGPLLLFYKVGPSPSTWWGELITSADGGKTWSVPRRLPEEIAGPIKNRPIELSDGTLVCGSSSEHDGWRVHIERTTDQGLTWSRTGVLNDGKQMHAIQPTILVHGNDRLQILCRSRQHKIVEAWSNDAGLTWSEMRPIDLPNSNSGFHAVTLRDGRHLLVFNHTARGRSPLNVAVSPDGKKWFAAAVLENIRGEFSYPSVMQSADGQVHITYTWLRKRAKHVVIDPTKLTLREIKGDAWPQ